MPASAKKRRSRAAISSMLIVLLVCALAGILATAPALAASGVRNWSDAGTPVCTAAQTQSVPQACSDTAGGAYIVWQDQRSAPQWDIYIQRVNAAGTKLWTGGGGQGILVASNQGWDADLPYPDVVADGSGGALVMWTKKTGGSHDIYVQRIGSNGSPLTGWPAGGVAVVAAGIYEINPVACVDGSGSTVVAWETFQISGKKLIFAQMLDQTGVPVWGAPVNIKTDITDEDQQFAAIASYGSHGAVIAFEASGDSVEWRAYAQALDETGALLYGADAARVSTQDYVQGDCRIAQADGGNVIIAYTDMNGGADHDLFAQKIAKGDGSRLWTGAGVPIRTAGDNLVPDLTSDATASYLAWCEGTRVFASRLDFTGARPWTSGGLSMTSSTSPSVATPGITTDGTGGAIVSWCDTRGGGFGIYMQRVLSGGSIKWDSNGTAACNTGSVQLTPAITTDGNHGAIAVWQDDRNSGTTGLDLYGQRMNSAPRISSLVNSSAYPGSSFIINGTDFGATRGTSVVHIGSFTPAAGDYLSWSDTAIQVRLPSNAYGGPIPVTVQAIEGTSNAANFYVAPYITSLSPTYGNAGVTYVTLTGKGFGATKLSGSSVWFGSSKSTSYSSWSNTSVRAKVGAGASGRATVKVMASCCYSNGKAFDIRPVINSISPTSGYPGTAITISGSAFCNTQGSGLVCFKKEDGTYAYPSMYLSWKQSQVQVLLPSGFPPQLLKVSVYTPGGMSNSKDFQKI